jgi:ABC transport system ATP-binding/permease protein
VAQKQVTDTASSGSAGAKDHAWRSEGAKWPKALRIPLPSRLGDWCDARKVGKAGLELCDGEHVPATPRTSEIRRALEDTAESERLGALRDTVDQEVRLAGLRQREKQIGKSTADLRTELTGIRESPVHRHPSEAGVADSVIAGRRANENRRSAAPRQAQLDQLLAEQERLGVEVALLVRRIDMRWDSARTRARRLTERARRRESRYWRIVLRFHPDGAVLLRSLRLQGPALVGWAADVPPREWPIDVAEHEFVTDLGKGDK